MDFWFPDVDTSGHHSPREQFGGSRRALARVDGFIGSIIAELERKKMLDRTYLFLFSDHGTTGGRSTLLQKVDLGRDFFFRPVRDSNGDGVPDPSSGMGCNVRWYDDRYERKGHGGRSFVFIGHAEGIGRIYLPHGGIDSGDWLTRNTLYELTHYRVAPRLKPVNLAERLLSWIPPGGNLYPGKVPDRPVDAVLVKLDDRRVAVFSRRGEAIIERKPRDGGGWLYRCLPVKGISASPDGTVSYENAGGTDPFGYVEAGIDPSWLRSFHTERQWLDMTKEMERPDAPVAISNLMFWDGRMKERERRYSPDMILLAAPGWSFEPPEHPSGAHGHLLYETMRIPLLVTGPNVRRGIILSDPVRTADITPTVLELLGIEAEAAKLDGRPLRGFLSSGKGEKRPPGQSARALLARLPYAKETTDRSDLVADYERRLAALRPEFLLPDTRYKGHDIERATDIHVVGMDIFSVFSWEVFTALDAGFDYLWPGERKRPFNSTFDRMIAAYDRLPDRYPKERIRELVFALQMREITTGEVPSIAMLSLGGLAGRGVLFRTSLLLRFFEHLLSDADHAMLSPVGRGNTKVISNLNYPLEGLRKGVDAVSWGIAYYVGDILWDAIYRIEKGNEKIVRAASRRKVTRDK